MRLLYPSSRATDQIGCASQCDRPSRVLLGHARPLAPRGLAFGRNNPFQCVRDELPKLPRPRVERRIPSTWQAGRQHYEHEAVRVPRVRPGQLLHRRPHRKRWRDARRMQGQLHISGEMRHDGANLHPALLLPCVANRQARELREHSTAHLLLMPSQPRVEVDQEAPLYFAHVDIRR